MATLQNSETNLACRQENVSDTLKGLGLSQSPGADELSNVMQSKLREGVDGTVIVMVKSSAGTCTVQLKAEATDTLSFASDTVDIPVVAATPVWGELAINGSDKAFWGIKVDNPVGLTWEKFCVLEASAIDVVGGENYHVASAAFNAKKTVGSGAVVTDWA